MAWTDPRTWTDGELVTAAIMNPHVRDNLNALGPHLIVRKTVDESVASSITFQNDDALLMALAANEVWKTELNLYVTGNGTADFKMCYTFPAGCSVIYYTSTINASAGFTVWQDAATSGTLILTADLLNTGSSYIVLHALVINGGTAGTLQLQWAQNTSNATPTIVKANSTLWAVKLA